MTAYKTVTSFDVSVPDLDFKVGDMVICPNETRNAANVSAVPPIRRPLDVMGMVVAMSDSGGVVWVLKSRSMSVVKYDFMDVRKLP